MVVVKFTGAKKGWKKPSLFLFIDKKSLFPYNTYIHRYTQGDDKMLMRDFELEKEARRVATKALTRDELLEKANTGILGVCYLLKADSKIAGWAEYYLGWSRDLQSRMEAHRSKKGSKLTRAMVINGVAFRVIRTWPVTDRHFERLLKNRKRNKAFDVAITDWPEDHLVANAMFHFAMQTNLTNQVEVW